MNIMVAIALRKPSWATLLPQTVQLGKLTQLYGRIKLLLIHNSRMSLQVSVSFGFEWHRHGTRSHPYPSELFRPSPHFLWFWSFSVWIIGAKKNLMCESYSIKRNNLLPMSRDCETHKAINYSVVHLAMDSGRPDLSKRMHTRPDGLN